MYYVLRTYKIVTVVIVIMTEKPVYFQLRMTPVLNCLSFTVCMIVVYYNSRLSPSYSLVLVGS